MRMAVHDHINHSIVPPRPSLLSFSFHVFLPPCLSPPMSPKVSPSMSFFLYVPLPLCLSSSIRCLAPSMSLSLYHPTWPALSFLGSRWLALPLPTTRPHSLSLSLWLSLSPSVPFLITRSEVVAGGSQPGSVLIFVDCKALSGPNLKPLHPDCVCRKRFVARSGRSENF